MAAVCNALWWNVLEPHRLPDSCRRSVENPFGFWSPILFASWLGQIGRSIPDTDRQRRRLPFIESASNIQFKWDMASSMPAEKMPVEKHCSFIVNCSKVQDSAEFVVFFK